MTASHVHDGWVETVLPGGAVVHATPNYSAEDIARAHALGYSGDVWAMTRDHDPMHVWLANALGLRESPALRDAFNGHTSELGGAEEEVILALQRFVNLLRHSGVEVTV